MSDPSPATGAYSPSDSASVLVRVLDDYVVALEGGQPTDRSAPLEEHPELASQLESCLAALEFIHRADRPAGESPSRLGDFRIVREVGRGGMGVVYEAEQLSLKRRVALKVLQFGGAPDSEALQRFQREAETVARLHHTTIVPVFAVGCEQGVNYYAMQFIDGQAARQSQRERNGGLLAGSPVGECRPPRLLPMPTHAASSTATSSRPTCFSIPKEWSG